MGNPIIYTRVSHALLLDLLHNLHAVFRCQNTQKRGITARSTFLGLHWGIFPDLVLSGWSLVYTTAHQQNCSGKSIQRYVTDRLIRFSNKGKVHPAIELLTFVCCIVANWIGFTFEINFYAIS